MDTRAAAWARGCRCFSSPQPRTDTGTKNIDRFLINSPMLPDLKKNPDGSLTIYMRKDSPGADKASNWLPAPDGPFYVAMRLYWPKEAAPKGVWRPPTVQRAK